MFHVEHMECSTALWGITIKPELPPTKAVKPKQRALQVARRNANGIASLAEGLPETGRRANHAFDRARKALEQDIRIAWPAAVQDALDALNPRQRRFAQFYSTGVSAQQAYIRAFHPDIDPDSEAVEGIDLSYGSELSHKPEIFRAVGLLVAWMDSEWLRDHKQAIEFCVSLWHDIATDPQAARRDKLRASELLAKASGAFVQRVEVTHHQGIRAEDAYALLADAVGQMQLGPGSIEAVYEAVNEQAPYAQIDAQPSIGSSSCPRCGGSYIYPDTIGGDGDGI